MKKSILLLGFLLGFMCAAPTATVHAFEDFRLDDVFDEEDEDDISFAEIDLDSIQFAPARAIIPPDKIVQLIEQIGGFDLLDQDFYKRTNPLVQRSLLDLPLWEMHSFQNPERWIVGGHLFWNKMDRSVFVCKSTNLSSYIDLEQNTLFNALDNISQRLKNEFPQASMFDQLLDLTNFQDTLQLFRNFTVEQRRTGIMLHAWRQWLNAEMRMLLPFYYIERNLFATPEEKQAIENRFGALSPNEKKMFEKNHGISDRVGFGDFRIEADYAVHKTDTFEARLGGFLTVPTAFAISKGIRGTTFDDCLQQPTLDLQELFDLIFMDGDFDPTSVSVGEQTALKEKLIGDVCSNRNGFLLGALDRFNAMVLDSPLGNGQHVGFGFLFRSRTLLRAIYDCYEWTERISWNNRASIEIFTPGDETRFFVKRNRASDFEALDTESTDEKVQAANLAFIGQELVDKFYPYATKARVTPGAIFHWFSRWCFSGDVWDIAIGSDVWIQRGEKVKNIRCVCPEVKDRLDICNGINDLAYQFKSVASFGLKILRPDYTFFASLNAEGTSWNKGIGDDWGVSLNLEANF